MKDILYILDVKKLDVTDTYDKLYDVLDADHIKKYEAVKNECRKKELLGAAMLLKLGLYENTGKYDGANDDIEFYRPANCMYKGDCLEKRYISSEVLADKLFNLRSDNSFMRIMPEFTYGKHGKTYIDNYPFFFNISHSGDYVCMALSEKEIGVDIQIVREEKEKKIAERFFNDKEKQLLGENDVDTFYRLWTKKEAYGKMTGEGLLPIVNISINDIDNQWYETKIDDKYYISVCKRRV